MWSQAYRAVCVLALVVLCGGMALPLAAASGPGSSRPGGRRPSPTATPAPSATPSSGSTSDPPSKRTGGRRSASTDGDPPSAARLRRLRANELGVVPVVMYHRIVTKRRQPLDRTPRQLRADLDRMVREDYVPITAAEFVSGRIDIPAGKHPVVLTFDDSTPSQLSFDAHGEPRRDTAVGVLLAEARRHPGFRPVATFYVISSAPFQEGGADLTAHGRRALRWLVAHGFDVGNHTVHHRYFRHVPRHVELAEIADAQHRITGMAGVAPTTLAYPGGFPPKPLGLAAHGSHRGMSYRLDGAFLAGAAPSPSPFTRDFPRYKIPRIRGQNHAKDCDGVCLGSWLRRLDKKHSNRYTADGDPAHISYPRRSKVTIAKRFRSQARPY